MSSIPLPGRVPGARRTAALPLRLPRFAPRSAGFVAAALALYMVLAANLPLVQALVRQARAPSVYLPQMLGMAVWVFCGMLVVLALFAWPRLVKPVGLLLVLLAAVVQHYMLSYRMVMDPSMVANVLQTDVREAADLMSPRLLWHVLLVVAPAALWLWRQPVRPQRAWRRLGANALLVAGALALAVLSTLLLSRSLMPLMRSEPQLRYLMNPLASLYSTGVAAARPGRARGRALLPIGGGAHLGAAAQAARRPALLMLVVGETARADHFGLNGYARDTTPELARRQVLSFGNVRACGTSTLASLPCMFSHLGRTAFESRSSDYENLLDVLQAAGLAVLWLDNQSGCKGVCERVPHAFTSDAETARRHPALCPQGECLDEVMLEGLDARLAALPPERTARGVVLVLHQMGSHGPAYHKRSTPALKRFLPECTNTTLSECSHAELVNAYDNSIAYTDHFLGRAIDWLGQRADRFDGGLLYLSDHGESLGEYGLYLHGMPYSIAPDVQKHVPMVAWLGGGLGRRSGLGESAACLRGRLQAPLTHDHLYPTVLGLMDVRTPTYQGGLDVFGACRSAGASVNALASSG